MLARTVALAAAVALASAAHTPDLEIMSPEEVAALHANWTRARELQTAPDGVQLTPGACAAARALVGVSGGTYTTKHVRPTRAPPPPPPL